MSASAALATTVGSRAPRRGPRVPARLLVGIALVAASVGGVVAVVAAADRDEPVLAARHVIAAGDPVGPDDLIPVPAHLGAGATRYLRRAPSAGTVAARTIQTGELVPDAAVEPARDAGTTSVVLVVAGQPAASVVPGARVDVWSAGTDAAQPDPAVVLASDAVVVRLVRDDGFGAASGMAVEVRVRGEAVAALLQAVAGGAQISVLPTDG